MKQAAFAFFRAAGALLGLCLIAVCPSLAKEAPPPPGAAATTPIVIFDPIMVGKEHNVPVRATLLSDGKGRLPVILFSHGNFLSRGDYRPLIEYWARSGFLVLQPDHADHSIDGLRPAASPPADTWHRRIGDMKATLDALERIEERIGRPIDRTRIAVAGHSFGGFTAEALAGARVTDPRTGTLEQFADRRIRAALLLAPPGAATDMVPEWRARAPYLAVDFATMRGPVLVVVGANDSGPMSALAAWRTAPYRLASPGTACLVTIAGAGHYLGGINGPFQPPVDADPARLALVREATTAFLRSALGLDIKAWPDFRMARGQETSACN